MEIIELTKKLISIPSFVDSNCTDKEVAEFLFNYLKKFEWLNIKKQNLGNGRFNIILKDKYPTNVILCGHFDTVQPRNNWNTNQFKPTILNGKIYGLGATDMKGSLSSLITALEKFKKTKGLLILLYADEEYDFIGMKKFIDEYKNKLNPSLIVSADGYELAIGNGCRGLIEITFIVKGLTGHASRPDKGKNALIGSIEAIKNLSKKLEKKFTNKELGISSCNLAFLQGGLELANTNTGDLIIGREGNNIADIAESVLDIRPSSSILDAQKVIKLLKKYLEEEGLKLRTYKIRHNYKPWLTSKKDLRVIEKLIKQVTNINYLKANTCGYIDTQMIWQAFNKAPSITFGAGTLDIAHKANEFVTIDNLIKAKEVYELIIESLAEGEKNDRNIK